MAEGLPEGNLVESENRLRLIALGLFFGGLFVLALGAGLFFFKTQNSSDDIQIISTADDAGKNTENSEIVVHVDGEVISPGVYKLAANSRVDDAVKIAGGLTADADGSRVNLAAKIVDGQKIYVPRVGDSVSQSIGGSVSQQVSGSVSQLISINAGSQVELESLPGIGPVTAQKIIAARPYTSLDDLLNRKVVSKTVWEKIKDLISL